MLTYVCSYSLWKLQIQTGKLLGPESEKVQQKEQKEPDENLKLLVDENKVKDVSADDVKQSKSRKKRNSFGNFIDLGKQYYYQYLNFFAEVLLYR